MLVNTAWPKTDRQTDMTIEMSTQRDKQESKTLLFILETHTVIYVIVNAVDNKRQTDKHVF